MSPCFLKDTLFSVAGRRHLCGLWTDIHPLNHASEACSRDWHKCQRNNVYWHPSGETREWQCDTEQFRQGVRGVQKAKWHYVIFDGWQELSLLSLLSGKPYSKQRYNLKIHGYIYSTMVTSVYAHLFASVWKRTYHFTCPQKTQKWPWNVFHTITWIYVS